MQVVDRQRFDFEVYGKERPQNVLSKDKFWNRERLSIAGEIVIGVPARGTLFITVRGRGSLADLIHVAG